jgi:drug/metabolite transporter (DMT)-like permease
VRHVLAILVGSLLWGLAWLPVKGLSGQGLSPLAITLTGYGAAALALLPSLLGERRRWWPRRPVLAAIAVSGAVWNLCFVAAMAAGEVSRLILLYYLSTGWAIVGGRLFLGEQLDRRRRTSVLFAFGGAVLVLAGAGLGRPSATSADLLAVVAGVAHATTNLLFRLADDIPVTAKNGAMFGGTAVAGITLLAVGAGEIPVVSGSLWLAAAAFGLGWVMVADSLVQYGVSHLPASRSAVLVLSELPCTILSATVLAGDRLAPNELGGGAMIVMATLNELFRAAPAAEGEVVAEEGA